jgi:queuine tRNA-ribosyltransferase
MNRFTLVQTSDNKQRAGILHTGRGDIETPIFLPVGSQASVKAISPDELHTIGSRIILSNTYHLYLRPGMDVIRRMGGLHKFMNWDGAILTDSGGYQVFSLAPLRKMSEEGVTFRSHIDGSEHFLTPELAIKYQEELGSDVIMVLDECPAHDDPREKVEEAMERTHRWARRCLATHLKNNQMLFAIIQGGTFTDLREKSAAALTPLDFDGFALGGLSLGEPKKTMYSIVECTTGLLPADKPRYLMGVGSPEDIIEGVARGIDIFDCALPTRVARNGALFTRQGRRNIRNAVYKTVETPVMEGCRCYTCRNFTAAYLHHLFNAGELLALRLATIHNLTFMQDLMTDIRKAILVGDYESFRTNFMRDYKTTDEEVRLGQKEKWLKNRRGKPGDDS